VAKTYKIAVLPGDGTGAEVVAEGKKVLNVAAQKFGFKLDMTDFDIGGDRYLKTGEILPDTVVEELKQFDSIYLGAIGHPDVKPGILEKAFFFVSALSSINTSISGPSSSIPAWILR
jgi:3-isopropylmalate dehydrogenase